MKFLIAAVLLALSGAAMGQAAITVHPEGTWQVKQGYVVTAPDMTTRYACEVSSHDPDIDLRPLEVELDCITWDEHHMKKYIGNQDGTLREIQ